MAALKTNVQGLGENQKSIESSIDAIKKEQDSLVKQINDLRDELNRTKNDLAEHRRLTGTDINEIAKNMKAATERESTLMLIYREPLMHLPKTLSFRATNPTSLFLSLMLARNS